MRFPKHIVALNPELREPETRRRAAQPDDMAETLYAQIQLLAPALLSGCVREYPFLTFFVDLAWPTQDAPRGPLRPEGYAGLAVEVDGGLKRPGGGKHASFRDLQKLRKLALAGWLVLRFSSSEVRHDPIGCIGDIAAALEIEVQL